MAGDADFQEMYIFPMMVHNHDTNRWRWEEVGEAGWAATIGHARGQLSQTIQASPVLSA